MPKNVAPSTRERELLSGADRVERLEREVAELKVICAYLTDAIKNHLYDRHQVFATMDVSAGADGRSLTIARDRLLKMIG